MALRTTITVGDDVVLRHGRRRAMRTRRNVGRLVPLIFLGSWSGIVGGLGGCFVYKDYQVVHKFLPVEATITKSEVGVHHGDGATYSVDIRFSYEVNGTRYTDGKWHWLGGSSSGQAGKEAIVERYPVGTRCTGYYNPDDPSEAVLKHEFGWLGIIVLSVGLGVPGIVVLGFLRKAVFGAATESLEEEYAARSAGVSACPSIRPAGARWPDYWPRQLEGQFTELDPSSSPGKAAIGLGIFALFWNGIVWTFVVLSWKGGDASSCFLVAFLGIFVLVGLGVIVAFVHQVLAGLRSAPARVAIEHPNLLLGDRVRVLVGQELRGRISVNKLTMTLVCQEWVRYRQGTDTKTATHTIREETTVLAEAGGEPRNAVTGESVIAVPTDAMHSFAASDNKIEWLLKVILDVPKWPNTTTEFKLNVIPRLVPPAEQDDAQAEEAAS